MSHSAGASTSSSAAVGEKRKWTNDRSSDRSGGHRGGSRGGGHRGGGGRGGSRGGRGGSSNFGENRPSGCFNCGKEGHRSADCTEPRKQREGGSACFNCGKEGHRSADCTEPRKQREGGSACFNCGKEGHRSADCTEPRKQRDDRGGRGGSHSSGRGGAHSFGDRPSGCFNCGKSGHKSADCTEPRKPREDRHGGGGGGGGFRDRMPPEPSAEQIAANIAASKLDFSLSPSFQRMTLESDVGIECFLNADADAEEAVQPFEGMFKLKQADFQVNEISLDGVVAHVRDTTIPKEISVQERQVVLPPSAEGEEALKRLLGEEKVRAFLIWCERERQRVDAWYAQHPRPKKPIGGEFLIDVLLTKSARTEIHDVVRERYPYIVSDAVNADYVAPTQDVITVTGEAPVDPSSAAAAPAAVAYVSAASLISASPVVEHPSVEAERASKKPKTDSSTTPNAPLPERKLRLRFAVFLNKNDRDIRSTTQSWPRDRPDYLRFTLYKENLGTMEAMQILSAQLRLNVKLCGFAGTKDKRAVTTQWCTLFKVSAEKFKLLTSSSVGGQVVKCGDFSYVPAALRLGDLCGNEFNLVIRNLTGPGAKNIEALEKRIRTVSSHGFINYFGLQRFGTNSIPTHIIGRALLKQDYGLAVALILMPRVGEKEGVTRGREYFQRTRDIPGTLARLPFFMRTEIEILRMLSFQGPNAFVNAIEVIPRAMRLMYVHAFQSWIWNKMASLRVRVGGGRNVIEGDLVVDRERADARGEMPSGDAAMAGGQQEEEKMEDITAATTADDTTAGAGEDEDQSAIPKPASESEPALEDAISSAADSSSSSSSIKVDSLHYVTSTDIAEKRYTISDVILPMPGHDAVYPRNAVGDAYKKLLEEEGIVFQRYSHAKGQFKDFCLSGNYRRLIQLPISPMKHKILHYSTPQETLHEATDWERLQEERRKKEKEEREEKRKKKQEEEQAKAKQTSEENKMEVDGETATTATDAAAPAFTTAATPMSVDPTPSTAAPTDAAAASTAPAASSSTPAAPHLLGLHLVFQLPSSTYATMLLRELMKSETSTENQKHLAKTHHQKELGTTTTVTTTTAAAAEAMPVPATVDAPMEVEAETPVAAE